MAFGLDFGNLYVTGEEHLFFGQADKGMHWKDADDKENLWGL